MTPDNVQQKFKYIQKRQSQITINNGKAK